MLKNRQRGNESIQKKLLSLALALVMCLGRTVPAFAAGTVKVVEDQILGLKVTMHEFLREETHRYSFDDGMFILEQTIYVVADNSTVTVEALEGRKYADPLLQGLNRRSIVSMDRNSPEYAAYQDFVNNRESYAYNSEESYVWDPEIKTFCNTNSSPSWPLTGVTTYTASPTRPEEVGICLDKLYGISPMCESDYAELIPVGTEQPTEPSTPTTPSTPDAPNSCTVKKGGTLGKIAAAEYGKAAEYKALFERNADRLKNANAIYEGQVIVLPAKK